MSSAARRYSFVLAIGICTTLGATDALAQTKPIPREILQQLQKDRAAEMQKQREADAKLLEELAAKEIESLTEDELAGGALAAMRSRKFDDAVRFARAALAKQADNVAMQRALVQSLCLAGKADDAQAALDEALKMMPDNSDVASLRRDVAMARMRAGQFAEAATLLSEYIAVVRSTDGDELANRLYTSAVTQMLAALDRAGDQKKALEIIDRELAALPAEAGSVRMNLTAQKATVMAAAGDTAGAKTLIEQTVAELKEKLAANADDEAAAAALVPILSKALELADDNSKAAARKELLDFVLAQFQKHPNSAQWLNTCASTYQMAIMDLSRSGKNDEAVELLTALDKVLADVATDDDAFRGLLENVKKGLAGLQSRLEAERLRQELVGQPMIPIEVEAWVNGSPLTQADLQGKVVVLDFWAVWCGPCIATFPHLREWQEKYADRGLVMVGLTKHYGYDWDEAAGQAVRATEEITPEQELAALEKFAAHHELKHRLAVMPEESELSKNYAVTGIPQIVVIDQKGVIRLIRVGSGEANAHDVEALLVELLGGQ